MKTKIFWLGILGCSLLLTSNVFSETNQQIEILFDASRSMNEVAGQSTRLEEAKTALRTIAEQITPGANVGLRVFGKMPVQGNVRDSCFDSKLEMPIQPYDKQAMLDQVTHLAANGQTPLGYSLELAGHDFSPNADIKKTVILISDGEESCGKDPINVIGALKSQGVNFVVHAIGFSVDPKTKAQLQQITNMTGGTYQDVQNAGELKKSLETVAVKENIVEKPIASPKEEEKPVEKVPEEKLLTANRTNEGDNLLAATAGGKIITASNEDLAQTIDGSDERNDLMSQGDVAVFAFKDNQAVLFEKFAIPVSEENPQNPGELLLSGSLDSPEKGFIPILKIHPKNHVDFNNINQEFKIEPAVAVRYLKIRVGRAIEGTASFQPEWKVYGKYLSDAELAEKLKNQKAKNRNLLSKEVGGRLMASSDNSFGALIDGVGDDAGDLAQISNEQEAVFGFDQDRSVWISSVAVPIFETSNNNCKTLEVSFSETSPFEAFNQPISLPLKNMVVEGNIYQEFKLPEPVKAKYLKVKQVEAVEGDTCELSEIQAYGIFDNEKEVESSQPSPSASPASVAAS